MAISNYPSKISLPRVNPGVETALEYLILKFPAIAQEVWQQRATDGKIHLHDGSLITEQSPYRPQQRIYYYREVESEPIIPFEEKILFQDEHLLIAYKPPFLPVTPGGIYVNECLQNRLREKTGMPQLQALHRLDRATTGLVMFSVNPETCHLYHNLFKTHQINKTYQAVAHIEKKVEKQAQEQVVAPQIDQEWAVINRLDVSDPRFLMQVTNGKPNSHSVIRCLKKYEDKALFELKSITGKTHQLRIHMQTLGWPIMHDRYYPTLQPKSADNYDQPLQLVAKALQFIDPVTQLPRDFSCDTFVSILNDCKAFFH